MKLFFTWRFCVIKSKNRKAQEAERISKSDAEFKKIGKQVDQELADLKKVENSIGRDMQNLQVRQMASSFGMHGLRNPVDNSTQSTDFKKVMERKTRAKDARLRIKARKDAIPDTSNLLAMLEVYNDWLIANVRAIQTAITGSKIDRESELARQSMLRPHYKQLLSAYEAAFKENGAGLDEKIIYFFDNYVHCSLPAFASDATLPSDPRVVYLGGNEKYHYASTDIGFNNVDRISRLA